MIGQRCVDQDRPLYWFNLDSHVAADHLLRAIDRFLDLADLRRHLAPSAVTQGPTSTWSATPDGSLHHAAVLVNLWGTCALSDVVNGACYALGGRRHCAPGFGSSPLRQGQRPLTSSCSAILGNVRLITINARIKTFPRVGATCAVMTAFGSEVWARRGKMLTSEVAGELIADAKGIMSSIGCQ